MNEKPSLFGITQQADRAIQLMAILNLYLQTYLKAMFADRHYRDRNNTVFHQ